MPTPRLAVLLSLGLLPAAFAIAFPATLWGTVGFDGFLLLLFAVDLARCPERRNLTAARAVEPVVTAGAQNPVHLTLGNDGDRPLEGQLADAPPPASRAVGHRVPFGVPAHGQASHAYTFNPLTRGDHRFGDISVRVRGPWGLAARQYVVAAHQTVKAYPDLRATARDTLVSAAPAENGLTRLRRAAEGRDFESLRPYVPGDDVRAIDWKATAKRQAFVARHYEPERNQILMVLLDCGRHMVSRIGERTKLDFAVDAALRLARVGLDRGDQVGLCAFSAQIKAYVPPKRSRSHLHALVAALYPLEAELVESDYDAAFNLVAERQKRRSLIVSFTDLLDEDSSRAVLQRVLHLRPRHLPLVVATADTALLAPARRIPDTAEEAYERAAARAIVHERHRAVARLRDAGALVVSSAATELSAAVVNQYLDIKCRGIL